MLIIIGRTPVRLKVRNTRAFLKFSVPFYQLTEKNEFLASLIIDFRENSKTTTIRFFTMIVPSLRAAPGHNGARKFSGCLGQVTDPPRGRPTGAAAFIATKSLHKNLPWVSGFIIVSMLETPQSLSSPPAYLNIADDLPDKTPVDRQRG